MNNKKKSLKSRQEAWLAKPKNRLKHNKLQLINYHIVHKRHKISKFIEKDIDLKYLKKENYQVYKQVVVFIRKIIKFFKEYDSNIFKKFN